MSPSQAIQKLRELTPGQIRDDHFAELMAGLPERRRRAVEAWRRHGPGTTRAIARAAGWDLLSLRPRSTELLEAGLLVLVGRSGHEGIYRLATRAEWEARRAQQIAFASGQMHFKL